MAEFGRVDILVNNAGVGAAVPASRVTPEHFRAVMDVNLNGCTRGGWRHHHHLSGGSTTAASATLAYQSGRRSDR